MSVKRLVAAAALALCGCSSHKPGARLTCSPPECAYDTTLSLVAEVQPTALSGLVGQEFSALAIDNATGSFQLALDPVATLTGTVTVAGAGNKPAGTVVATRPSRISGRPAVTYSAPIDPQSGQFTLPVSRNLEGESYTVQVVPADPTALPPMARTVAVPGDKEVDFDIADPLLLPQLHGTIVDSLQNPVAGLQLQATDPDSGRVLSTTVVSDASGAFSLRLVQNVPGTVLLTATPPTDSALPTLTQSVATSKISSTTDSLTVNLAVPALPATVHVSYTVQGLGTSGALTPAPGAVCVFTTDVTDANAVGGTTASFSMTAMTDSDGDVGVDLIPPTTGTRSYSVTISPDASSNFQPLTTTLAVGPTTGYGPPITLPLRPQLSGQVVDPSNKPIDDLTVMPTPATIGEAQEAQSYAALTQPQSTQADDDGRFAVRLNPGTWDIGLIPPASSLLPRVWLSKVRIDGSDVRLANPVPLPMGVAVKALVVTADGQPVPEADVRLYTVAADNGDCGADDIQCLAPARLRSEAISNGRGELSFVLLSKPN